MSRLTSSSKGQVKSRIGPAQQKFILFFYFGCQALKGWRKCLSSGNILAQETNRPVYNKSSTKTLCLRKRSCYAEYMCTIITKLDFRLDLLLNISYQAMPKLLIGFLWL